MLSKSISFILESSSTLKIQFINNLKEDFAEEENRTLYSLDSVFRSIPSRDDFNLLRI